MDVHKTRKIIFNIDDQNVDKKTGEEFFFNNKGKLQFQLKDFWSWNQSDILNNALRGVLAEYIVATAIEAQNEMRIEWDAYDLVTEDGIKVEVKSAAYLQSWKQRDFSNISFNIRPTIGWDSKTNEYDNKSKRQADVYVFCLLKHKDKLTVNPLNLEQWEFYILQTKKIDEEKGNQKSISLNSLLKLNPVVTDYNGIKNAVEECKNKE